MSKRPTLLDKAITHIDQKIAAHLDAIAALELAKAALLEQQREARAPAERAQV